MSTQIKQVILYNDYGEKRIINFSSGLNIITGQSRTGKSTIIRIIDYCLGRSTFEIPAGPIRNFVAWYAVLYQINNYEVIVAKPSPEKGKIKQSEAYFEVGTRVNVPELDDLWLNSNDEAIVAALTERIGIGPNINIPEEGQTREPLQATLRHAKFLLFQPQRIIANDKILFYRQDESSFIGQAIKDTLPYFLGAIKENRLALLNELRENNRQLRIAQRDLRLAEETFSQGINRGQSLSREAEQVGLLSLDGLSDNLGELLNALEKLLDWQPTFAPPIPDDRIAALQQRQDELYKLFEDQQAQIRAADMYINDESGFLHEADAQIRRLESIHLFDPDHDVTICPLCSTPLNEVSVTAQEINASLEELSLQVGAIERTQPDLEDFVQELRQKLNDTKQEIRQTELDIRSVLEEQSAAEQLRDTNSRIARVVGRISLFLDITSEDLEDDISELRKKVEDLRAKVNDLEKRLDSAIIEERLDSIRNIIGLQMTDLAKEIDMEYPGPYRLDIKNLTVVADRAIEPIVMGRNMGSAANILGAHLISHLALHRFFIQEGRPVPNFLVLDQPTQVYSMFALFS